LDGVASAKLLNDKQAFGGELIFTDAAIILPKIPSSVKKKIRRHKK